MPGAGEGLSAGPAGHVVRVAAAAAAASVRAGRGSAAPSERRRGPGRAGAAARGAGAARPGAGRAGGQSARRGEARLQGRLGPGGARAPLSLAAPRPEHLPGGTETKEDSCPKVGPLAGPPAPAGKRVGPPEARLEVLPGGGGLRQEPTRGDICTGTRTHGAHTPRYTFPQNPPTGMRAARRPSDTQVGTQMRTARPALEHTQTRTHMPATHRYQATYTRCRPERSHTGGPFPHTAGRQLMVSQGTRWPPESWMGEGVSQGPWLLPIGKD